MNVFLFEDVPEKAFFQICCVRKLLPAARFFWFATRCPIIETDSILRVASAYGLESAVRQLNLDEVFSTVDEVVVRFTCASSRESLTKSLARVRTLDIPVDVVVLDLNLRGVYDLTGFRPAKEFFDDLVKPFTNWQPNSAPNIAPSLPTLVVSSMAYENSLAIWRREIEQNAVLDRFPRVLGVLAPDDVIPDDAAELDEFFRLHEAYVLKLSALFERVTSLLDKYCKLPGTDHLPFDDAPERRRIFHRIFAYLRGLGLIPTDTNVSIEILTHELCEALKFLRPKQRKGLSIGAFYYALAAQLVEQSRRTSRGCQFRVRDGDEAFTRVPERARKWRLPEVFDSLDDQLKLLKLLSLLCSDEPGATRWTGKGDVIAELVASRSESNCALGLYLPWGGAIPPFVSAGPEFDDQVEDAGVTTQLLQGFSVPQRELIHNSFAWDGNGLSIRLPFRLSERKH